MNASAPSPGARVAIACGGTGGHLFPGMAVGEELLAYGCRVLLLISPKEIDQEGVRNLREMEVMTLPAVGFSRGRWLAGLGGLARSWRAVSARFASERPAAVLGMGGFISAPAMLAAGRFGALRYLHEANAIPGRANRWLASRADACFVGFEAALPRLRNRTVICTGTPVRPRFTEQDRESCRMALGLRAKDPVLLITGGSQGAAPLNQLAERSAPALAGAFPRLQILHLTGPNPPSGLAGAYEGAGVRAVVRPFLTEMELALGAATTVLCRAGASFLAELAATRVPGVLVPYPSAADNHQWHNAQAYVQAGAARLLDQGNATADALVATLRSYLQDGPERDRAIAALGGLHTPHAAEHIAVRILAGLHRRGCAVETRVGTPANGEEAEFVPPRRWKKPERRLPTVGAAPALNS